MVYKPKNPLGYKNLLTWKQSADIYHKTKDFTLAYLDRTRDRRLSDHMNDSARSVQRNIEEGYKRATTKEYVQFLGFSRASLEELKGDFEELKREWREGIRWKEGKDKGRIREKAIREKVIREKVIREIEGLLDLIYGEDCMMGRQILSLERKMVEEKTLPQKEMITKVQKTTESRDKKFWKLTKEKFGIERDEKGIIKRREDKGK